ncbi:MAG: hypothetical protein JRI49_04035 [Deltaproteobacteria bacterium]|nr:hypothetical protein [Deltaproteobacteria bacterium]
MKRNAADGLFTKSSYFRFEYVYCGMAILLKRNDWNKKPTDLPETFNY